MQDAIIKGNGNSRYLKTVAAALSLYPTYEDFLQALVAGNFPIDLNGINEAGWTQKGTPLNKANLLPDTLATSLGLGTDATVADALKNLYTIPDGKGVLMVYCTDVNGEPVSGCVVTVGTSVTASNVYGFAKIELDSGTYSGTVRTPIDYGAVSSSFSDVVIRAGEITAIDRSITDTLNGAKQIDITTSMTAAFSSRVVSADAFGVGGGGSGAAVAHYEDTSNFRKAVATGGAGGYTKTILGIPFDVFVMTIGTGGVPVTTSGAKAAGYAGGQTSIKSLPGSEILAANGGEGGTAQSNNATTFAYGANGGSGSGGALADGSAKTGQSGSNGDDGGAAGAYEGGTGQGTTTKAFGESDGELFSSAGGSCAYSGSTRSLGQPGTGAGAANGTYASSDVTISASSATTRGSGGGAAVINSGTSGLSKTATSGAGADGLIRFRWEVA